MFNAVQKSLSPSLLSDHSHNVVCIHTIWNTFSPHDTNSANCPTNSLQGVKITEAFDCILSLSHCTNMLHPLVGGFRQSLLLPALSLCKCWKLMFSLCVIIMPNAKKSFINNSVTNARESFSSLDKPCYFCHTPIPLMKTTSTNRTPLKLHVFLSWHE